MKFKIIAEDNIKGFEEKVNDFIKNVGAVLDIQYESDDYCWIAYVLYEDIHYKNPWAAYVVDDKVRPV